MGAWSEGDADHVAARVDAEDLGGDSARNGDVNGGKGAPLLPPVAWKRETYEPRRRYTQNLSMPT